MVNVRNVQRVWNQIQTVLNVFKNLTSTHAWLTHVIGIKKSLIALMEPVSNAQCVRNQIGSRLPASKMQDTTLV